MKTQTKKRIYKALAITHRALHRSIIIAVALIFALSVLYVYLVGSAIAATVVYKDISKDNATLYSKVADLETEYLHKKNTITHELAVSLGFSTVDEKRFVERSILVGRAN